MVVIGVDSIQIKYPSSENTMTLQMAETTDKRGWRKKTEIPILSISFLSDRITWESGEHRLVWKIHLRRNIICQIIDWSSSAKVELRPLFMYEFVWENNFLALKNDILFFKYVNTSNMGFWN